MEYFVSIPCVHFYVIGWMELLRAPLDLPPHFHIPTLYTLLCLSVFICLFKSYLYKRHTSQISINTNTVKLHFVSSGHL